jgi:hypothetical protein
MQLSGLLAGNAPLIRRFQIGEAMATAGVPVVVGGAGNAGVVLAATTTASDLVGITTDSQATLVTAQQTDNSDPERAVSVIINPDMILKAILSGGAAANTALTTGTVDTASTTGLDVNTEINYTNFDEGAIFGHSGANAGVLRKITVGDATDASVTVAFPVDIAVGDVFVHVPFIPGENQFVQLTTNLDQVDASATVDTDNNNFRVFELLMKDASEDGTTSSHVLLIPFDSIWAGGGSI